VVLKGGSHGTILIVEGVKGRNVALCLKELGFVIVGVVRTVTGFFLGVPDVECLIGQVADKPGLPLLGRFKGVMPGGVFELECRPFRGDLAV
jgi:hypothetical protein